MNKHWTISFCKSASKLGLHRLKIAAVAAAATLAGLGLISSGLLHDGLLASALLVVGAFLALVIIEDQGRQRMIWFARTNQRLVKLEAPLDARFENGHAYFAGLEARTGEPVLVDLVGDRPFRNIFPQNAA